MHKLMKYGVVFLTECYKSGKIKRLDETDEGVMEMNADGRCKGGGESRAERRPRTYFGVMKWSSSFVGTSSSQKGGVGSWK
jgi:hypothetical protein